MHSIRAPTFPPSPEPGNCILSPQTWTMTRDIVLDLVDANGRPKTLSGLASDSVSSMDCIRWAFNQRFPEGSAGSDSSRPTVQIALHVVGLAGSEGCANPDSMCSRCGSFMTSLYFVLAPATRVGATSTPEAAQAHLAYRRQNKW